MPMLVESGRFFNIEDAQFLRNAIDATCKALGVDSTDKAARAAVSARVADLVRYSGLRRVDVIQDRIVREARALADIAA